MAKRASLVLRGLIMERRSAGRVCERGSVARQAEQIHIAHLEQVNVGRAVRHVAYGAAFDPYRLMFVYEWPAFIGVAVIADLAFRDRSAQLMRSFRAVRVMAIGALDQAFVHAVSKGHGELRLLLLVARIAKRRLALHQQKLTRLRMVSRMARGARDVVPGVQRIDRVPLLSATRVATLALGIDCFWTRFCEKEQLGSIRWVCDVIGAWSVTGFTALFCRSSARVI